MRRNTILATIGLLIATVVVIIGASFLLSPKPNTQTSMTDQDTGENFDITVNNIKTGGDTPEGTSGLRVIFGIEKFMNAVYKDGPTSSDFATDVRNAIYKYSDIRLHNSFTSITLRPQNLVISKSLITGQLRLGQSDKFADFSVQIFADGKSSITKITASGQKDFYYIGRLNALNTTLYSAQQDDYSIPSVTINTFAYREAALESLKDLGYPISDLNIKFTGYTNPFL